MKLARRWIAFAACLTVFATGLLGKGADTSKTTPKAYTPGGPIGANLQILLGTTSIQIDGGFATQVYSVRP